MAVVYTSSATGPSLSSFTDVPLSTTHGRLDQLGQGELSFGLHAADPDDTAFRSEADRLAQQRGLPRSGFTSRRQCAARRNWRRPSSGSSSSPFRLNIIS
jgi:hypothetical protein